MHIKKYSNLVLEASVEHPLNLLGSTIHAADILVVLVNRPVANWQAHSLDASLGKSLDVRLIVPRIPMCPHPLVGVVGVTHRLASLLHDLAKTVRIEGNISLLLV